MEKEIQNENQLSANLNSASKTPTLSPRLKKIADMIPKCDCFADIGTDHGYLPVYLCAVGVASHAIACDIKKDPLNRAQNTILNYNAKNLIQTRLGGGLEPLNANEADAIVIAGMGGLLIADILKQGIDKLGNIKALILQPMSAVSELREFLILNRWHILSEALVTEGDKIYNILSVKPPENYDTPICLPSKSDLFIGRYLIDNRPENFDIYIKKRYKKIQNMILGLEKSNSQLSESKLCKCKALKRDIEEIMKK